ncbi:c-type cytochrome [Marinobacter sp.]|uniref:c-type cytochrome n=1 Tax=Marinobacter sp. TaxID=50741 RepID=UPI001994DFF5|nr:c-type cytochrome [Marinobacter sp.]MBC7192009.1 cytochrome c4 [Marinobacter sp.]
MRYFPITLAALGLVACASVVEAASEGDPERGAGLVTPCATCHQADGSGKHIEGGQSWPRLAGLNARYFIKQYNDIKSGSRQSATMMPFVNMLNGQQLADVAAYYARMEPTPGQGGENASEGVLERGKQIAERGDWSQYIVACRSCHGPGSRGAGEAFPGIAGQHAGYIEAQLKAWKEGTRNNDPQNLMGSIAKRMGDEDIHAVAVWLANQSPVAE